MTANVAASAAASSTGASVSKAASKTTNAASQTALVAPSVPPLPVPQQHQTVAQLGVSTPIRVSIDNPNSFWQEPGVWISIIAIIVSLFTLWFNFRTANTKEAKARRQSINDEFWLREVLFPLSIEPAINYYSSLLTALPEDRFSTTSSSVEIDAFKASFSQEQAALVAKSIAIGILSQPLFVLVRAELESIEDAVSNYCFDNMSGYDPNASGQDSLRNSVVAIISGSIQKILTDIKIHQETIT